LFVVRIVAAADVEVVFVVLLVVVAWLAA